MIDRYVRFLSKFKYIVLALWIVIGVVVHLFLPSLNSVVAHKDTQFLPSNEPVVVAQNLLKRVNPGHTPTSTAVVAIHRAGGLTSADVSYFRSQLKKIQNRERTLGVQSVQDAFNSDASVASKFISHDHTTDIAIIGFPTSSVDVHTTKALTSLKSMLANPPSGASVLFTGDAPIQADNITISMQGASKTAGVTVALVLLILLVVFRSVVTPLLTLLSIGLSYLITGNLVAVFGNWGMPVSTFTNTFLIAIIFGAGTDYSIMILNRFREECAHGHSDIDALAAAFRGILKTVVFSSLTVFVSFAVLYFAHFGLFKSAVGVAVGVAVTLFACLTFLPALMLALGRFVFWPRKRATAQSHRPSAIWAATGRVSLRHPWWTILGVAVVLLPIGLLFTNLRTFDPTSDIPTAPSVKAFHTVSNAFGAGEILPMDIVIQSPDNLRSSKGLTTIEEVSKAVAKLPTVKEVDSATRPTGKVISAFQLANQNQLAANGLNGVRQGLNTLAGKLEQSNSKTSQSPSTTAQLSSGAKQVAQGTQALEKGIGQTATDTNALAGGSSQVANGANQVAKGQQALQSGASQLAQGTSGLATGTAKAASGATALAKGASASSSAAAQVASATSQLANAIAAWAKTHPTDAANPTWQQILSLAQNSARGAAQASGAATQVATGSQHLATSLQSVQQGASQVNTGATSLAKGMQRLTPATTALASGSQRLSSGTQALAHGLTQLQSAASSLSQGATQVSGGVNALTSGLAQLGHGQTQLQSALTKLSGGTKQVEQALKKSNQATFEGDPGFYVPSSAISSNKSLLKAMNAYISPNGHIADIRVMLVPDPYSMTAIQDLPRIEAMASSAFQASPIHSGTIRFTGTTPTQAELNSVSSSDFTRTMFLILGAIFILLVILLRSIIAPLYMIASLAGTYYVTMGILQNIAVHILGKSGVSWTVPFFVLLLLVALGVDYSIFLLSRFDEELRRHPEWNIRTAMFHSMRNMGNVIFSAAAIMAGTFGSMAVSGVNSLVEIGISVVVGLALYSFVLLALFVPACTAIVNRAHFWPFMRTSDADKELEHRTAVVIE